MSHFAIFLFWIIFAHVIGALVVWRAALVEARFLSDPVRVAQARVKIGAQSWRGLIGRVGAAAQLVANTLLIAAGIAVLGLFAMSAMPSNSAYVVQPSPLKITVLELLLLVWLLSTLVAVAAMLLCRCNACAGAIFDNSQPSRKTTIGYLHANWRVARGRGACPRCGAPFP